VKNVEVADLSRKLSEAISALGQTQHENEVEHNKLQENVISLKEDVLKLQHELSEFQLKSTTNAEEKEALTNELSSLQNLLRAMKQQDEVIADHNSSIEQLPGAEVSVKENIHSSAILSEHLSRVKAQLAESEELRESESREILELEEVVESLEIERSNLLDLVSNLRIQIENSAHFQNLSAPADSVAIETEPVETKKKLQQVMDFLVAEKSANELLVELLQEVNSKMTTSLAETAHYKSIVSSCEQQVLDSKFLYETSKNAENDQILGLDSALKTRTLEVLALKDEISAKCLTIDTLNQSKSKLETDCENMHKKIIDISSLLDSLPSRENYASLESSILVQQREIDRLQHELHLSISSQNSMVSKGDFDELDGIIVSQKAHIQVLNTEIDKMRSMEISERVKTDTIEKRLEDQRCLVERIQNEKELRSAEILALETKFAQLDADKGNLLSEKDKLIADMQKASDTLTFKLDDALRETAESREERERLRRKLLDLESTIEELQQKSGENFVSVSYTAGLEEELKILRARLTDMDDNNANLRQQYVLLELSTNDTKNLLDSTQQQLESANSRILLLESESKSTEGLQESSLQDLKEQVADLSRKLKIKEKKHEEDSEAYSEKIRRLKVLLSKTKQLVQEKEEELADAKKLTSTSLGRPSNANVKCRILLAGETQKDKEGWCFISDENGKNRWILESILQQYSLEGTLVVNCNDEYMNVSLERRIAELKFAYENEIETLRTEIDENEKKFIAYKERAQVALKRMNKDEHDVKRKAQVDEEFNVKQYLKQISDLESRLDDISFELSSCRQDLSNEVLKSQEYEKKCEELESLNKNGSEKIRRMNEEIATLSKMLETDRLTFTSDIQLISQKHTEEVEKLKAEHQHILSSRVGSPVVFSNEKQTKEGKSIDLLPMTVKTSSAMKSNSSNESADSDFRVKSLRSVDIREKMISGTPALKTPNRSILLSHTEDDMTQSLAYLRDENASLSADYNELKQDIALLLEQVIYECA
jgi:predicted  nucleic acid-binding Zn-ribbon protein